MAPRTRPHAVKVLDDPVTCRELRNLELRGDKVDHPSGYHDDRANALCLAAVMAAERTRVSESGAEVTSVTTSFVHRSAARPGTDQSMVHPHERIEK